MVTGFARQFTVATKCFCFALTILLSAEAFSVEVEMPNEVDRGLLQPEVEHRLVVKFNDDLRARCVGGKVVCKDENATQYTAVLAAENNLQFRPLLKIAEAKLGVLTKQAAVNSGRKQPDLCAMMVVEGAKEQLQQVALTLRGSKYVNWVEFERLTPPPSPGFDIAPLTPNYTLQGRQGYLGPNPGLNTLAFQAFDNSRGEGVKLADCEYWFHAEHEDLCDVIPEPGQTLHTSALTPQFNFDGTHGTSALGVSVGVDNSYGVCGISNKADAYFFPTWTNERGFDLATAIANAVAAVGPGGIVLLEMQTSILGGELYGPTELINSIWNVVRVASDSGVIVVAAAGNGDQDLDSSAYASYRARGDSGAIIVGAGTPSTLHSRLDFSTFGSRVNVQGWGRSVFTLGDGDFSQVGGSADRNQFYTSTFGGTSSASAMLAGVCAALQSYAVAKIGRPLTPAEMREVLTETGHPQSSGGNIGPFPDMVEAADYIISSFEPEFLLGDVNRDESVNFLDIGPFIGLLASSNYRIEADINFDGQVSFLDIAPFINLLSQGGGTN